MVKFVDFRVVQPRDCKKLLYANLRWAFYLSIWRGRKDATVWLEIKKQENEPAKI